MCVGTRCKEGEGRVASFMHLFFGIAGKCISTFYSQPEENIYFKP
jgi:hypothetical protein